MTLTVTQSEGIGSMAGREKGTIATKSGKIKTDYLAMKRFAKTYREMVQMADEEQRLDLDSMEGMLRVMGLEATVAADNAEEIQKAIIESILSADSVEEALSSSVGELESGRALVGESLTLMGVRWNQSDFVEDGGGLPFYGVVEAVHRGSGEKVNFSCGATTAVAQLFRINRDNAWPIDVIVKESGRTTKRGYKPYWFEIDKENPSGTTKVKAGRK